MALQKRREGNTVYLQAKHFCLWQEFKKHVAGCEEIEVTNPKTGQVITKFGNKFDTVTGHAVKIVKYDTGKQYATRYFGFKLHLADGTDVYVLDMPYQSQMLRRFLRVMPNFDWSHPISITVFKGKDGNGKESLGVWFRQGDETVRPYFTKDNPNGMPAATHDEFTNEWDFRGQHRWLLAYLVDIIMPEIDRAASVMPEAPESDQQDAPPPADDGYEASDSDVPF